MNEAAIDPVNDAVDPAFAAQCARCATPFTCGVNAPGGCWCARLPQLPARAIDADRGCLCPRCLDALIVQAVSALR